MLSVDLEPSQHPLAEYVHRFESGLALLQDSPENVLDVVGILKSYGVVLDAYSINLCYIANHQFLVFFPFFKYFNGEISLDKLLKHWFHNRINYEYAEYCMKYMLWHGGGNLDSYIDSPEFSQRVAKLVKGKFKYNLLFLGVNQVFPEFLTEHMRQMCYYSALGQFWRVMSDMSDRYDRGEIKSIPDVVKHVQDGLVAAAAVPYVYNVTINGNDYDIVPKSANLSFLMDTAVPYVEAVFFRSFPFRGTVSYNAQAQQISPEISHFNYGVLYADPLPIGGAGIPPTLLMQDMRHYLPQYLRDFYKQSDRGEEDLLVKICLSFQKSMFCVTTAALRGLAPHPFETQDPKERKANDNFLAIWLDRLSQSRLYTLQ